MKFINNLTNRIFGPAPDTKIVVCLRQMAEAGRDAARVLEASQCKDLDAIVRYEHTCDAIENAVHALLDEVFELRYFDKRDIEHLSGKLDDIVDGMRRTVKHVARHAVHFNMALPAEAKRLLAIIREVTDVVYMLALRLEHRNLTISAVSELVDQLDQKESEADNILNGAEKALLAAYPGEFVTREDDAWEKFYRHLEKITDSAYDAGRLVLSIARK